MGYDWDTGSDGPRMTLRQKVVLEIGKALLINTELKTMEDVEEWEKLTLALSERILKIYERLD